MKTYLVKNGSKSYTLTIPTSIDEITPEYIQSVTANINVAPNYSLVGLIHRTNMFTVLNVAKNKKQLTTAVIPILAKSGDTDSEYIKNINCGDKLLIASSVLAMGLRVVTATNELDIDRVLALGAEDKDLFNSAITDRTPLCFLEFKMIANCDIQGSFGKELSPLNHFIVDNGTVSEETKEPTEN